MKKNTKEVLRKKKIHGIKVVVKLKKGVIDTTSPLEKEGEWNVWGLK